MSSLSDEELLQALADRVTAAVHELNAASAAANDRGLVVVMSDYSVRQMQDRFDRRIYSAEVLRLLT